jgi:hypothetical protein
MLSEDDAPAIARQVALGVELGRPREFKPAAQGAMGRIWRLDTESGAFAVKGALWPAEVETLPAQLELDALISERARTAGILASQVRRTAAGSLLLSVYGSATSDPTQVRVASWIEGAPCDRATAGRQAAEWLGSTVAVVECLPDPPELPPIDSWLGSWFSEAPDVEQWQSLADRSKRERVEWADRLTRYLPAVAALGELVDPAPPDRLTVTRTDQQPSNVLVTRDGYAVLDWDDVAPMSRDRTLARVINDWHLHDGEADTDGIGRTLAAYRVAGGTGALRERADFGDLVASFLNYLFEQAEVSLDRPHGEAEARTASGRVASMLAHPLDVQLIDRLLELVRDVGGA